MPRLGNQIHIYIEFFFNGPIKYYFFFKQINLIQLRPKEVLSLQVRVNLGVMAMKRYSTLPRSPELKPYNQMQFSVISRALVGIGLTSLQRYSQHTQ